MRRCCWWIFHLFFSFYFIHSFNSNWVFVIFTRFRVWSRQQQRAPNNGNQMGNMGRVRAIRAHAIITTLCRIVDTVWAQQQQQQSPSGRNRMICVLVSFTEFCATMCTLYGGAHTTGTLNWIRCENSYFFRFVFSFFLLSFSPFCALAVCM